MNKEGSISRVCSVGICEGCLCLISYTGHGEHRRRCPNCGEMVRMTPAADLVSGFQVVADAVEQILPESIFHNRPISPWPVLHHGQWHIDVRFPSGGEYESIARKYFPLAYQESISHFMEQEMPAEAVMGDWLEESVVIAQDEVGFKELFRFVGNLNERRNDWNVRKDFHWQEIMASWVSSLSLVETEQLINKVNREPGRKRRGENPAITWLKQQLKAHRNIITQTPHVK